MLHTLYDIYENFILLSHNVYGTLSLVVALQETTRRN